MRGSKPQYQISTTYTRAREYQTQFEIYEIVGTHQVLEKWPITWIVSKVGEYLGNEDTIDSTRDGEADEKCAQGAVYDTLCNTNTLQIRRHTERLR